MGNAEAKQLDAVVQNVQTLRGKGWDDAVAKLLQACNGGPEQRKYLADKLLEIFDEQGMANRRMARLDGTLNALHRVLHAAGASFLEVLADPACTAKLDKLATGKLAPWHEADMKEAKPCYVLIKSSQEQHARYLQASLRAYARPGLRFRPEPDSPALPAWHPAAAAAHDAQPAFTSIGSSQVQGSEEVLQELVGNAEALQAVVGAVASGSPPDIQHYKLDAALRAPLEERHRMMLRDLRSVLDQAYVASDRLLTALANPIYKPLPSPALEKRVRDLATKDSHSYNSLQQILASGATKQPRQPYLAGVLASLPQLPPQDKCFSARHQKLVQGQIQPAAPSGASSSSSRSAQVSSAAPATQAAPGAARPTGVSAAALPRQQHDRASTQAPLQPAGAPSAQATQGASDPQQPSGSHPTSTSSSTAAQHRVTAASSGLAPAQHPCSPAPASVHQPPPHPGSGIAESSAAAGCGATTEALAVAALPLGQLTEGAAAGAGYRQRACSASSNEAGAVADEHPVTTAPPQVEAQPASTTPTTHDSATARPSDGNRAAAGVGSGSSAVSAEAAPAPSPQPVPTPATPQAHPVASCGPGGTRAYWYTRQGTMLVVNPGPLPSPLLPPPPAPIAQEQAPPAQAQQPTAPAQAANGASAPRGQQAHALTGVQPAACDAGAAPAPRAGAQEVQGRGTPQLPAAGVQRPQQPQQDEPQLDQVVAAQPLQARLSCTLGSSSRSGAAAAAVLPQSSSRGAAVPSSSQPRTHLQAAPAVEPPAAAYRYAELRSPFGMLEAQQAAKLQSVMPSCTQSIPSLRVASAQASGAGRTSAQLHLGQVSAQGSQAQPGHAPGGLALCNRPSAGIFGRQCR